MQSAYLFLGALKKRLDPAGQYAWAALRWNVLAGALGSPLPAAWYLSFACPSPFHWYLQGTAPEAARPGAASQAGNYQLLL